MLKPDQRKRYEEMAAARSGGGRQVSGGRVWVPAPGGRPRPVDVRVGLSDGTYSELVSGDLSEGSQVIIGTLDAARSKAQQKGGPRFGF
jgi:HlyD family secretion protein